MDRGRRHSILLVEDNVADVKIMQRALAHVPFEVNLVVARDGQEALDYLLQVGPDVCRPPSTGPDEGGLPIVCPPLPWRSPDLVVLDLNLPRLTGVELLKKIRQTPLLSLIPVVVLSTSRRPEDVREAYAAGANTYVEKPRDFDRFVEILRTTLQFWLDMVILPPEPAL
jgi:two-component system, chemotaxis family, response regulator Rcp1